MKFFKYFIFSFLFISFSASAGWIRNDTGAFTQINYAADWACREFGQDTFAGYVSSNTYQCKKDGVPSFTITQSDTPPQCKAGASNVYSGSVTIQNWKDDNEYVDLVDSASSKFTGTTVCSNSCIHKFDFLGSGEGDSVNGPVSFKGRYVSTAQTCTTPTQGPTDTLNGTKTPTTDGCKNGESYCDKPPTGCPTGYASGSFNGKQICVKNNPDPTKPNPNDPNNGGGSNFDDSRIIAAINDSKNAITSSINNAVNSISNSINSINQSISNVTSAINGTTNAVNTNTNAVNAVKSSVDALHNTINAVTTAVNNNTTAVTSAVNSNTTATNAVKSSVDALNSTVSAVTTAVDKNTTAVNANGDKVTNAVNQNTSAVNAVKDVVNNLNNAIKSVTDAVNNNGNKTKDAIDSNTNAVNANGDKVTNAVNANGKNTVDAINTNGKNTVDAIDKGTEATKENGKKLDGIKDGIDEGNGILKEIKDWLFADVDESSFEAKTPMRDLEQKDIESDKYSVSGQCPVSKTFSFKGHTFTLDLSNFCYVLNIMGIIIGIAACLHGVAILSENT